MHDDARIYTITERLFRGCSLGGRKTTGTRQQEGDRKKTTPTRAAAGTGATKPGLAYRIVTEISHHAAPVDRRPFSAAPWGNRLPYPSSLIRSCE